jgi:hypothetical protein
VFSPYRTRAKVLCSSVLFLVGSIAAHGATVNVVPTVANLGGGMYEYSYNVSYTGTDDAFLVDISVPANPGAVTNLMAPSGFNYQFDSVNGLVSFLENTSTFTATPTSGFSFESPDGPGSATFVASVLDSTLNISTISGSTTAPVVTPEPASLALIGLIAPALILINRRRLAVGKNDHKNGESI